MRYLLLFVLFLNKSFLLGQYSHNIKTTQFKDNEEIRYLGHCGAFQDSRGLIWMQYETKLFQFDGQKINLVSEGEPSLYQYWPTDFAEDQYGNIWRSRIIQKEEDSSKEILSVYSFVGNKTFTLADYIGETSNLNFSENIRLYSIDQVPYISDIDNSRLYSFNGQALTLEFEFKEKKKNVLIVPGPVGNFWVFDSNKGLRLINPSGGILVEYFDFKLDNTSFFLTKDKRIWSYTGKELPQKVEIQSSKENKIDSILKPQIPILQFNIFTIHDVKCNIRPKSIGVHELSGKKISIFWGELNQDTPVLIQNNRSLKGNIIDEPKTNIKLLSNGNLMTFHHGNIELIEFYKNQFNSISMKDPIRGLDMYGDSILLGTIFSINKNGLLSYDLKSGISNFRQTDAIYDVNVTDDSIWLSTALGNIINRYNKKEEVFLAPEEKEGAHARDLFHVNDSIKLLGTEYSLIEFDTKKRKSKYLARGLNFNCIHQDAKGNYWAGTNKGLYNVSYKSSHLEKLPNGSYLNVSYIYEDPNGTFWICSQQGLIKWKPYSESFNIINNKIEFSSPIVHAAYPDNRGRLWLSSNHGIMSFDTSTHEVRQYFVEDGLAQNEMNYLAHTRSMDGTIFFGTNGGITFFHPDSISNHDGISFNDIFVKTVDLYNDQGILSDVLYAGQDSSSIFKLETSTKQVKIEVGFANFTTLPYELEWRQDSPGSEWQQLPDNKQIFLLNLPYGSFKILFRARIRANTEIVQSRTITFYHIPPITHRWWFKILMVALFIGVVWLYAFIRTKIIAERNTKLNEMVKLKTSEINDQKNELLLLNERKNQLFQNISHELRTPLSLISLATEDIMEVAETNENVELIQNQTSILRSRVQEILALKDLDQGMIHLNEQNISLSSFIDQQYIAFQGKAEAKQIFYQKIMLFDEEVVIKVDEVKLGHVLSNLIGNALKFTPNGGHVVLRSELKENTLSIMVADDGPGISEEQQAFIFERGFQGDSSKDLANPGYGIGLSLCKEYVEALNGDIRLESKIREGAKFFISIPITVEDKRDLETDESDLTENFTDDKPLTSHKGDRSIVVHENSRKESDKVRILVVEDNVHLSQKIKSILEHKYFVDTVENGQLGLEALRSSDSMYDLIISDIMMPVLNGYEFLEQVRNHPDYGFIPFLFISALASDNEDFRAFRLGIDGYIQKPFDKVELLILVENKVKVLAMREAQFLKNASLDPGVEGTPPVHEPRISYDDIWIKKVEDIMRKNLSRSDFKIVDIASELHISERSFRDKVKQYTGFTPVAYLQKARLDQAMIYIHRGKYKTISEIAYSVGFLNKSYFAKIFKKEFGKTPSEYL